ncbi:transmembrane protein 238 [Etheostoma spectabile]|uniref:transmembrane protein 238 n=1 Tax=Etheostoma spectabile TaxID=54343 RepID=UPI0013AFA7C1|nr:transmembrane protein 238-like [Etheostoma spectabile]XP_032393387.1 transmembrane protein 238-like [Etheostoma spectabile]
MELKRFIGGCVPPFLIAFVFDVLGLILLFVGIFANVRIGDRFYGDFLIYSGSLIIFSSLAFWLMWYVGNVQVSEDDEVGLKKSSSIVQLARKLSERLSQTLKGESRVKCVEGDEDGSQVEAHKASRVTWGRSTAYHNKGYDDCLDSPSMEKTMDIEPEEKTEM